MVDTHKLIGKKAKNCPKCLSDRHFINRIGGIQCRFCAPPVADSDVAQLVKNLSGVWVPDDFSGDPAALAKEPIVAQRPAASAKRPANQELPITMRGADGRLSAYEIWLAGCDEVWGVADQFVTIGRAAASASVETSQKLQKCVRKPLPAVGTVVELSRAIPTFQRPIAAGVKLIVSAAFYDEWNERFVDLSSGGRTLVCGVKWPIGE